MSTASNTLWVTDKNYKLIPVFNNPTTPSVVGDAELFQVPWILTQPQPQ